MLDVEMRDSGTQDQEVTDVIALVDSDVIDLEDSDVIDLEDSDSDDGEVNEADLANIAVDLSDGDSNVIALEDSDSDEGEVNGADLANIAVDLSDEDGENENGQCVKAASQAILEVEHGGHGKAPGTEDGRR